MRDDQELKHVIGEAFKIGYRLIGNQLHVLSLCWFNQYLIVLLLKFCFRICYTIYRYGQSISKRNDYWRYYGRSRKLWVET